MSNIFKTNSRFAALAEDIPAKKDKKDNKQLINDDKKEETEEKFNSFKSDNNSFKNNGFRENIYNRYSIERERLKSQEKARKEEEERKKQSFTIDNFPELLINMNETNTIYQEKNYLEKLKKVDEVEDKNKVDDPDLKNLKPGWILIKKDKYTNKIVTKCKTPYTKTHESPKDYEEYEEDEEEIAINILNALVELHEIRRQEYIDLNGYDTWEKNFKFPNWKEREAQLGDESDGECEDGTEEEEYM
jgi:hypothetical protein